METEVSQRLKTAVQNRVSTTKAVQKSSFLGPEYLTLPKRKTIRNMFKVLEIGAIKLPQKKKSFFNDIIICKMNIKL